MFSSIPHVYFFVGGGKVYSQSAWMGAWPELPLDPPLCVRLCVCACVYACARSLADMAPVYTLSMMANISSHTRVFGRYTMSNTRKRVGLVAGSAAVSPRPYG